MSTTSVNQAIMRQTDHMAKWFYSIHDILSHLEAAAETNQYPGLWLSADYAGDLQYEGRVLGPELRTANEYFSFAPSSYHVYDKGVIRDWMRVHRQYFRYKGFIGLDDFLKARGFRVAECFGDIYRREFGKRLDPFNVSAGINNELGSFHFDTGPAVHEESVDDINTDVFAPSRAMWLARSASATAADAVLKVTFKTGVTLRHVDDSGTTTTFAFKEIGTSNECFSIFTIGTGAVTGGLTSWTEGTNYGHLKYWTLNTAISINDTTIKINGYDALTCPLVKGMPILVDGWSLSDERVNQRFVVSSINAGTGVITLHKTYDDIGHAGWDATTCHWASGYWISDGYHGYSLYNFKTAHTDGTATKIYPLVSEVIDIAASSGHAATAPATTGAFTLNTQDDREPIYGQNF